MKRIILVVVGVMALSGLTIGVFGASSDATPVHHVKAGALKVGQTITIASDTDVTVGTPDTFGPFSTNACTTVSVYVDQAPGDTVNVLMYVAGLPGQVNLVPAGISGLAASNYQSAEIVPSMDVSLNLNGDGGSSETVANVFLYCGR
jgi:hypothetical protein